MLYGLQTGAGTTSCSTLFDVPAEVLPEIVAVGGVVGEAELLGARVPIAGIAGDQQAALFGQGCLAPGAGQGHLRHRQLPARPRRRRPGPAAARAAAHARRPGRAYALEGSVFVAGAAVQWLRDGLGVLATAAESEALAASVPDTGGVYFVPALAGLGSPYWDADARGAISGLTAAPAGPSTSCAPRSRGSPSRSRDVVDAAAPPGRLAAARRRRRDGQPAS